MPEHALDIQLCQSRAVREILEGPIAGEARHDWINRAAFTLCHFMARNQLEIFLYGVAERFGWKDRLIDCKRAIQDAYMKKKSNKLEGIKLTRGRVPRW